MGILLQAFYWDCPRLEHRERDWWRAIEEKVPSLAAAGFTALWLPPASKAANLDGPSMGYDPYDYYDLGDVDQKGGRPTFFGTKEALQALIGTAHHHGLQLYADLVFNHNSGADAPFVNLIDGVERWTEFDPKSRRFPRNWECFHPSPYETWDREMFGGMPDLCHRNPYVYTELLTYARWLLVNVGFDGFRYDLVKGYGAWMTHAIQELRAVRDGKPIKPFGVGECWDSDRVIADWLHEANSWSDNPVAAFDFPLRWRLRDLCDSFGFDMRTLASGGTLLAALPANAVTFVENHDVGRSHPIVSDKMLAYAFILTHEGYPCVFWQDYFVYGLGEPIAALMDVHRRYAGGTTSVLYADQDLYVMQRGGWGSQPGLVLVLNNRGSWNGANVQTQWHDRTLRPAASHGHDLGTPDAKRTDGWGNAELWAPPRGYAVYVAE